MSLFQNLLKALFLLVFFLGLGLSVFYERKSKIAPVPTLPWVRKKILVSLQAVLNRDKAYKMAELGSGWGGLGVALAKAFPLSSVEGFELSPIPFWFSVLRSRFLRNHLVFYRKDFFLEDLSDFDVVVCYLSPYHMERLKGQLGQLKKGSVVVSNAFEVPGWKPVKIHTTHVGVSIPVFTYVIQ